MSFSEEPVTPKKRGIGMRGIATFVVVALCILTLLGMLVPAVCHVQNAGYRMQTMTNLNQLAMAVNLCHDTNKTIPPYNGPWGAKITAPYTFHVHIFLNIDSNPLYSNPAMGASTMIPVMLSRLDPGTSTDHFGVTNFPVNIRLYYTKGGNGVLNTAIETGEAKPPSYKEMTDGASNTLLLATTYQYCGGVKTDWLDPAGLAATFGKSMDMWQQAPRPADCVADGRAVGLTKESIQVVFCDRNTRNLTPASVTLAVWAALHTPSGGEVNHNYDQ